MWNFYFFRKKDQTGRRPDILLFFSLHLSQFLSTFIHFHPIPSAFIQFYPFSMFIHIHPIPSIFINFISIHSFSSTFIHIINILPCYLLSSIVFTFVHFIHVHSFSFTIYKWDGWMELDGPLNASLLKAPLCTCCANIK